VIRIDMSAALEVGEMIRGVRQSIFGHVEVRETGLASIGTRYPPEEMVEGPILHHQHDDVIDAGFGRRGKRAGRVLSGMPGCGAEAAYHRRSVFERLTA
jgi:hypothetical protein